MGMNMKDGLPGIGVGVEDNPIPTLEHPFKLGNLPAGESNIGKELRIGSSKLPKIPIPGLGHNEDVNLRLRPNIPEGKGGVILVDDIGRDLTSNDPLEESLILTHEEEPYRRTRAAAHRQARSEGRGGSGGEAPGWGSGGLTPRGHNEREAAA